MLSPVPGSREPLLRPKLLGNAVHALDLRYRQASTHNETHRLVQPPRRRVALADVQKRHDTALPVSTQERMRQAPGAAAADEVRVRTDTADFLQAIECQALAGHGDEGRVREYPEVETQFGSTFAKVIGKRDPRQRQHAWAIGNAQRSNV